ncbi:MAG: hypothetical protein ACFFCF_04580 [Promethearchaeota archaeon]
MKKLKPSYRYGILLVAGIANVGVGMYAFVMFARRFLVGKIVETDGAFVGLGCVATLVGVFLVYRMLPALLRIRRGEPAEIWVDERMQRILYRAGFFAFSFLLVALLMLVSMTLALLAWDIRLTWMQLVPLILGVWIASLFIFAVTIVYLYTK